MNQGIVVCTWSGGREWANLCLNSINQLYGAYPIYVVMNDADNADKEWVNMMARYFGVLMLSGDHRELGAIKAIVDHTDLDEFWFLQDTIEITDYSFILSSFASYSGQDVTYARNHLQYYLGMWDANILRSMEFPPMPKNKQEAIEYEHTFGNEYAKLKGGPDPIAAVVDPKFDHLNSENNYISTLFGEERLAVVGKYLIKRVSLVKENLTHADGSFFTEEFFQEWKKQWQSK